jgi:hypothetical protein
MPTIPSGLKKAKAKDVSLRSSKPKENKRRIAIDFVLLGLDLYK